MNRNVLTILLTVLLLFAFGATDSVAQRGAHDHQHGAADLEERVERHVSVLDARLDLTDDQEERIQTIFEAHEAQMSAWREANEAATHEERDAHHTEAMASLNEQVRAVLTSEQREEFELLHERMYQGETRRGDRGAMREGRRHQREHRGAGRMQGDRMRGDRMRRDGEAGDGMRGRLLGMRLAEELDLSDSQKEQVTNLHEAHRAAMQQWREQNPDATLEERRAWMQESAEQHHVALEQILTDEQRRQFEELRNERVQERRERMQERSDRLQERSDRMQERSDRMQERSDRMQERRERMP